MKRKTPLYAALDLHSAYSVLGSMDHDGRTQPRMRFATQAEILRAQVKALKHKRRPLHLTMEAGALTRWASGIVRPLVERLIICEPRHNRLINSNPTKCDEADVEGMCLLLRAHLRSARSRHCAVEGNPQRSESFRERVLGSARISAYPWDWSDGGAHL